MFALQQQSLGQEKGYNDNISELQCSSGIRVVWEMGVEGITLRLN